MSKARDEIDEHRVNSDDDEMASALDGRQLDELVCRACGIDPVEYGYRLRWREPGREWVQDASLHSTAARARRSRALALDGPAWLGQTQVEVLSEVEPTEWPAVSSDPAASAKLRGRLLAHGLAYRLDAQFNQGRAPESASGPPEYIAQVFSVPTTTSVAATEERAIAEAVVLGALAKGAAGDLQ